MGNFPPDPVGAGRRTALRAESVVQSAAKGMELDLRLLEVFCQVYERRSFTQAALALRLSQPTVSAHIKKLEGILGIRLFDRLSRSIRPTHAARVLHRHGQLILRQRDQALQELRGLLDQVEGSLTVGASTIPGEYLLPPLLGAFHQRYPGIELQVDISDSRIVCEQVAAGQLEVGFVGVRLDSVGLEFRYLASDELVLVVPNQEPWQKLERVSLPELVRLPFLAREPGSGTRLTFERMVGRALEEFNVVATLSSTNAIKEGLKAGLGLSVLSILSVQTELGLGLLKVVPLEGLPPLKRHFYTAVNRRLSLSPLALRLLEFLDDTRMEAKTLGVGKPRS